MSRKGIDLEAIGKVAELVPTSSPFQIGMSAKPKKEIKPFTIVGRLQLSTGSGTWDEWSLAFGDGRTGWLSEAQGEFFLMMPMPPPEAPEFEAVAPGQQLELRPYGSFLVAERRQATYVSASGELQFVAPPGSVFRYADLSGSDGSLATLDYGVDPGLDDFYVGRKVQLEELGIDGLAGWSDRKVSAKAASLNCPNCGGPIELKNPAGTIRVACPSCGSLLSRPEGDDSGSKFEVLDRLNAVPFQPSIPLGSTGTLLGHPYVVLGAVRKSCVVDGTSYYWTEFLLKEPKSEAYHWLVESNGHWSHVVPVPGGSIELMPRLATYQGRRYRLFQKSEATVEAVLGEFYWTVSRGDKTTASDFVAPPRILSKEEDGNETTWSEGTYVEKDEVEKAFSLKTPLAEPEGVGANQPWPRAEEEPLWRGAWFTLAIAAILLYIFFNVRGPKAIVFDKDFPLEGAAPSSTDVNSNPVSADRPAQPEPIVTEPFAIPKSGNLKVTLEAPTDNTWVAVGVSLIDQHTGDVRSFSLHSDYFHGNDGGESWSEGVQSRSVTLSQVPEGSYVLRLDPETEPGKAPNRFHLRLRSGVPTFGRLLFALFLLWLGPLALTFSKMRFEGRRWAESDMGEGSGSNEDSSGSDDQPRARGPKRRRTPRSKSDSGP